MVAVVVVVGVVVAVVLVVVVGDFTVGLRLDVAVHFGVPWFACQLARSKAWRLLFDHGGDGDGLVLLGFAASTIQK